MSKKPSIVLVTASQPALNPRLVKEADALSDAGYAVLVIYAYWNDWGDKFTKQLLPQKKWRAVYAGGHPTDKPITYFFSRLLFKIARLLFFRFNIFSTAAVTRSTFFLIGEARKHKASLYIGHNLGALPAVVKAAKRHQAKCGFDAEDFHRQEVDDYTTSINYLIAETTEDCYFPAINYLSTSSPEIATSYKQLYPQKEISVILNVFNQSPIKRVNRDPNRIKLFWFSQTIGRQRGLQDVIQALNSLANHRYELHLLGALSVEDRKYFSSLATTPFLHFHAPVPPDEIIEFGSQFDVGLALEPGFSANNNKALSNKLFSYLQSGLAIIATQTEAQYAFLKENPSIGFSYAPEDAEALASVLIELQADHNLLNNLQENASKLATNNLNWNTESLKFLNLVADTFKMPNLSSVA